MKYVLVVGSVVAYGAIELVTWIGDLITHYAALASIAH